MLAHATYIYCKWTNCKIWLLACMSLTVHKGSCVATTLLKEDVICRLIVFCTMTAQRQQVSRLPGYIVHACSLTAKMTAWMMPEQFFWQGKQAHPCAFATWPPISSEAVTTFLLLGITRRESPPTSWPGDIKCCNISGTSWLSSSGFGNTSTTSLSEDCSRSGLTCDAAY